jgi:hypothetical protein
MSAFATHLTSPNTVSSPFNYYKTMKFVIAILLILAVVVIVQSAPTQLNDTVELRKREADGGAAHKREASGYQGGVAQIRGNRFVGNIIKRDEENLDETEVTKRGNRFSNVTYNIT